MKTTRRNVVLLASALFACFALASCGDSFSLDIQFDEEVKGGEEITTDSRTIETSFSKVEICCDLDIDLTHDAAAVESVQITTNKNLHEFIDVSVENDTLIVSSQDGKMLKPTERVQLQIDGFSIEALEVRNDSTLEGELAAVDKLTITVLTDSSVTSKVDTATLNVEADLDSTIVLSGRGDVIDVVADKDSLVDITSMDAVQGKVSADNDSTVKVTASGDVEQDATGDSTIDIN